MTWFIIHLNGQEMEEINQMGAKNIVFLLPPCYCVNRYHRVIYIGINGDKRRR
jgi:hypothetical protein